jgi:hypothetical protein
LEDLLVTCIVVLKAEDSDTDQRVSEDAVFRIYHVVPQLSSELLLVIFMIKLDPVGLFDLHSELLARLAEIVVDVVGHLEVRSLLAVLVNHDPLLALKVHSLLNGQLSEDVLINVDDLATLPDLGRWHHT